MDSILSTFTPLNWKRTRLVNQQPFFQVSSPDNIFQKMINLEIKDWPKSTILVTCTPSQNHIKLEVLMSKGI